MAFRKDKAIEAAEKYASRGQFDKAAREYESIVANDPRDLRSWLLLADALTRAGKTTEAVDAYVRVGQAYAASNDLSKALAVFRQVLAIDASRVDVQLRCAVLLRDSGRIPDAISMYEAVGAVHAKRGQIAQVHEICQTIAQLDPSNVKNLLRMAELFSREERTDEAVAQFRMAADLLRERGLVDEFIRVAERLLFHRLERDVAYELTRVYLELGQPQNAMRKLNALLQQSQSDVVALELLAQTMQGLGKTDKAVSVVLELVKELLKQGQGASMSRAKREALRVVELALTWKSDHPGLLEQAEKLRVGRSAPSQASARVGGRSPRTDSAIEILDPNSSAVQELHDIEEISGVEDLSDFEDPDLSRRSVETSTSGAAVPPTGGAAAPERATLEPAISGNGPDLPTLLREGRVLVKYRLFEHALAHLGDVLASDPNLEQALEIVAEAAAGLERSTEAAEYRVRHAQVVMAREPALAIASLRQALELAPGHPRAEDLLAILLKAPAAPTAASVADEDDFIDLEVPEVSAATELPPRARARTPVALPEQQQESARASLEAARQLVLEDADLGVTDPPAFAAHLDDADRGAVISVGEAILAGSQHEDALDDGISTPLPPAPIQVVDAGALEEDVLLGMVDAGLVDVLEKKLAGGAETTSVGPLPASLAAPSSPPPPAASQLRDGVGLGDPIDDEVSGVSDLEYTEQLARHEQGGQARPSPTAVLPLEEPEADEDRFGLGDEDGAETSKDVQEPVQAPGAPLDDVLDIELRGQDAAPATHADVVDDAAGVTSVEVVEAADWADLSDELGEVEFFLSHGLEDDARATYVELQGLHPGHPGLRTVAERLGILAEDGEDAGADVPPVATSASAESGERMDQALIGSIVADEVDAEVDDARDERPELAASPIFSFEDEDEDADFLSSIFEGNAGAAAKKSVTHRAVANVSDADAATSYDLGTAYFGMGLAEDAIKAFESASHDATWRGRAMIMLGAVKRQIGDVDGAEDAYRAAVDAASSADERSEAHYELASTLETRGDVDAAREQFEKVGAGFRDRDERIAALEGR